MNHSILKDIEEIKANIPEDVKFYAEKESLERKREKSMRKKKRKLHIGECLFKGYEMSNQCKDPGLIARMIEIEPKELINEINSSDDNYIMFHFPHEYIPEFLTYLGNLENIEQITEGMIELTFEIYNLNNRILDEIPQCVAAAIIIFYFQKNSMTIRNKEKFLNRICKTSAIINKPLKMINSMYSD